MQTAWQHSSDTCSVALRLDRDATARIEAIWERLYVAGLDESVVRPFAEPCIRLTRFAHPPDFAAVIQVLEQLAQDWEPFFATLGELIITPGLSPCLSLGATHAEEVHEHHRALHGATVGWPHHSEFLFNCWQPRVLVSDRLISVAEAVRVIMPMMLDPISARAVSLDLSDDGTGAVIWSGELGATGQKCRLDGITVADLRRKFSRK